MTAALAAGYCGEPSVEAFLSRIGTHYPDPTAGRGRTGLWLKDAIDEALDRLHCRTRQTRRPIQDAADLISGSGTG